MKKGQFTLFVILGVLLLLILGLTAYWFFPQSLESPTEEIILSKQAQEIDDEINDCFEDKIDEYLVRLGESAGNIDFEEYYTYSNGSLFGTKYTTLYRHNQSLLLPLENMKLDFEKELSSLGCFKKVIIEGNSEVSVQFDDTIKIRVLNPSSVILHNQSYTLPLERTFERELSFPSLYTLTEQILNQESVVPLTELLDSPYTIKVLYPDNTTILYIIQDEEFILEGKAYTFLFAVEKD